MKKYDNIVYFTLNKELPGCNKGDIINIIHTDGRECLTTSNGIELPYDIVDGNEDWFNPITVDEHKIKCYENTIKYIMDTYNLSISDAKEKLKKMQIYFEK